MEGRDCKYIFVLNVAVGMAFATMEVIADLYTNKDGSYEFYSWDEQTDWDGEIIMDYLVCAYPVNSTIIREKKLNPKYNPRDKVSHVYEDEELGGDDDFDYDEDPNMGGYF